MKTYIRVSTAGRVGNSLFHSKSLILKSDHEQFAHVALYKRATWVNRSLCSLKKSDVSWFATDVSKSLSKYEWFARKIRIFRMFLTVFPLINAQERIAHIDLCSHRSLLTLIFTHSPFFKERRERFWDLSNLLRSLIKKERMWAIRSCTSVKRAKVRFAQKKPSKSHLRSFAHKKTSDSLSLEKRMSDLPTLTARNISHRYCSPVSIGQHVLNCHMKGSYLSVQVVLIFHNDNVFGFSLRRWFWSSLVFAHAQADF